MRIEQTLHGYDDGHRLLASSISLSLEEERTIDLLSDLSGYLPTDTDFDAYDTGYPCGRFYVLARTWPDREGKRAGTVFTHSLLLPRNTCDETVLLSALSPLFRPPSHPIDRPSYQVSLTHSPWDAPEPLLSLRARKLLAALWFGQDLRPMLWTDPASAEEAARMLWAWLPSWQRTEHAFCTFAIQPRYLGTKLFGWLALAKGADGAFYSLRERTIRCDGQNAPQSAGPLLDSPWVTEIAEAPPDKVQAIWQESLDLGLPRLPAPDLRVFLRYREFRGRAKTNLTAALTRVDLLRRLAPLSEMAALEKNEALFTCLRHARDMAPEQRELTVALDLLARDPRTFAPTLSAETGSLLAELLEARAVAQPELAARVVNEANRRGLGEPAREGVLAPLRRLRSEDAAEPMLDALANLTASLLETSAVSASDALGALPREARPSLVRIMLSAAGRDRTERLARAALSAATTLEDPELLSALLRVVPPADLLDAAEELLARAGVADPTALDGVVAGVGGDVLVTWVSARSAGKLLAPNLSEAIASSLPEPEAAMPLLARMLHSPSGAAVLVAYAANHPRWNVHSILVSHEYASLIILRLAQAEPERRGLDHVVPTVVSGIDPGALLDAFDISNVERWQDARWTTPIVRRVVPVLVDRFLAGATSMGSLRAWLASMPCQRWLRTADALLLADSLAHTRGESLLLAVEVLRDPSCEPLRENPNAIRVCFGSWTELWSLKDNGRLVLEWVSLVQSLQNRVASTYACAASLQVALRYGVQELAPLAEVSFARVHHELCADSSLAWSIINRMRSLLGGDWDRARSLRRKLVTTWVRNDWPPLTLLRAADGDEHLFAFLVRDAKDVSGGRRALRQLMDAAEREIHPDPRWHDLLLRLPRSVREEW